MSKTARITILTSADFKAQLQSSAKALGISVSELVRRRFEENPSSDEAQLVALTAQLRRAVATTHREVSQLLGEKNRVRRASQPESESIDV